jgi:hypothetical protein
MFRRGDEPSRVLAEAAQRLPSLVPPPPAEGAEAPGAPPPAPAESAP